MSARAISVRARGGYSAAHVPLTSPQYLAIKRVLDVILSLVLIALLFPLMLVIAAAILLDSPGPVIFRQNRVLGGRPSCPGDRAGERTFEFIKFRTMYHHADQGVHRRYVKDLIAGTARASERGGTSVYKLCDDPRVTRLGRLLRATSLDELPQLINVLRGEMSLVWPRPAIPYEVRRYRPWHRQRLAVKGRLTGLWQVSERNWCWFDEIVPLDIEYIQRRSLRLDLSILLATIPAVVSGRGVV